MQARPSKETRAIICPQCGRPCFPEEIEGLCLDCLLRMLSRLEKAESFVSLRSPFDELKWLLERLAQQ
jgi:hypothetical protein